MMVVSREKREGDGEPMLCLNDAWEGESLEFGMNKGRNKVDKDSHFSGSNHINIANYSCVI